MPLITLGNAFTAPKQRPKAYKAKDAAFAVGGNRGFYIASLPRSYPSTPQQRRVRETASYCKIQKGMKKSDLQIAMVKCVGPRMRGETIPDNVKKELNLG